MSTIKKKRINRIHPNEFKDEAVALASRIGVAKAARQLDLSESLIYGWRQQRSQASAPQETDLAKENAYLKRELAKKEEELAIVKKAATYFARELK